MTQKQLTPLYIGTNGYVAAINPLTGAELWRVNLPSHADLITITIRGPFLYAGASGHVYCLDRRNGGLIWHNGLKGMGYAPVMMAIGDEVASSSQEAAAAHTEAEKRKRDR